MGKKTGLDFGAFDQQMAEASPALAARIGVKVPMTDATDPTSPQLRIVPTSILEPNAAPPPAVQRETVMASSATSPTRKRRSVVVRADGSQAGRIAVYLAPDIDLRLRRYCFESGRSITEVAGDMLSESIAKALP